MRKKIISLLLLLFLIASCVSCSDLKQTSGKNSIYTEEAFLSMSDEIYFNEITGSTLDLHFQIAHPEDYGIEYFEPTFGTYNPEYDTDPDKSCDFYIKELKKYNSDSFSENGKLIYDILLDFLNSVKTLNKYEYFYESLSPTSGFQATLPLLLSEYQFYDKDDVTDYIKLLNDMPRYFDEIAEYQRKKSSEGFFMSDRTADETIEQCKAFIANPEDNLLIEYFDEKINGLRDLSKDEITLFKEENRDAVLNFVVPSYQKLIDVLTELKGTGTNDNGLAGYDKGKEYYEAYVKYRTGSSKSVKQMKKALENKLDDCIKQITRLTPRDSQILTNIEYPAKDPNDIIEHLKTAISSDFPLLENAGYNIKYVHESLKDFLNPAMYIIPPIDEYAKNYIYINIVPEDADDSMFTTVAHESFPGHLYQNVYFMQSNPELIQTLISPTGYTEGWGLYTEIYSFAYAGFDEDVCKALQINSELIHCLYALADIGIHYDGWTLDEYKDFWLSIGLYDEGLDDFYQYIVTEPGVYLPYVIGYLEIMELRNKTETALGNNLDIKDFHKFLLEIGPAPFPIIEQRLSDWIKNQK